MKKIAVILSALALTSVVACQKEVSITMDSGEKMSFEATIPETKTTLATGDIVKWSASDLIDVYGVTGTTSAKAIFEITELAADGRSAKFTIKDGETLGTYDNYYAVYPSGIAGLSYDNSGKFVISTALELEGQAIVSGGYDPSFAIMTASASAGTLTFRHGMCYFGIQIPDDGITKVTITATKNVFCKKPEFLVSTGGSSTSDNGGTNKLATASGTFTKGAYYYLCGTTRKSGNNDAIGNLTVTYTKGGVEKSITTSASTITSVRPAMGKIYDLGCPPINPSITAADVNITKDATGGSITFTVYDPVAGGVLTAATTDGKTNTITNFALGAVGDGTVAFTCDANTEGEKKAYVTLTYTYNTSKTVTKDIVITQAAATITPHTYVLYVNSSGVIVQTEDGTTGASYFTKVGEPSILTCSASSYFGADSFTILGNAYSKAIKLESSKYMKFTTRSGVSSSVTFYGAAREKDETAKMQLKQGSTVVKEIEMVRGSGAATMTDSGSVALSADTEYSINKNSKEQGLFYVVVTESAL